MRPHLGFLQAHGVSIRAPLARGDWHYVALRRISHCFNPRPSCEGRSEVMGWNKPQEVFQSAPLLRGAIQRAGHALRWRAVSIRAPLARGDVSVPLQINRRRSFNPRPSCEGRSPPNSPPMACHRFQSAPLLRGAMKWVSENRHSVTFQSAPLLRGAIAQGSQSGGKAEVSIRAPLARGDTTLDYYPANSTVSIRAPLARGDGTASMPRSRLRCFNPRPSCEGRSATEHRVRVHDLFQSAPLLRGAMRI